MDQDQEHIVEDQPLKVLDLFSKREIRTLSLNYQNYSKLYQNLTCTICRQLFKNPVYLKCSHRFCKECIEKYIRSSTKRSCPNCRGQLSTKRDLRNDYSLQSLITFAFTDVKSFTASMQQFDRIDIQRSKSLDLKRIDYLNESKQKTRQQTPQQFGNITPGFRRIKTSDIDQTKKKRKIQSQKKIQTKNLIQKQEKEKEKSPTNNAARNITQKQALKSAQIISKSFISSNPQAPGPIINIENFTRQRGRKKKIQIIQIESNSEQQQVKQIRREQFLNPSQMIEDQNICSISMIPQVSPQVQSRIFSFQQVPNQQKNIKQTEIDKISEKELIQQRISSPLIIQRISDKKQEINSSILRAIELLKIQFGSSFPIKIIELTSFPFYTQLTLKKHPLSILTPQVVHGSYKFSLRTALNSISAFISDILNISKGAIKLYTLQDNQLMAEINQSLKLYQVNQCYWKKWSGIDLIQVIQLINSASTCSVQSDDRKIQRTIYYSIDFSKIAL